MSQNEIKNMAASVRARLRNISRENGHPFQEVVQQYAMERFLNRLSHSHYADKFILKGGLMFRIWGGGHQRPTKDIDLLGNIGNDPKHLLRVFQEISAVDSNDGLEFLSDKGNSSAIIKDGDYKGVRVKIPGILAGMKVLVQVDIGFGDVVYPHPEIQELPTVLDQSATRLNCYCKESLIAEKFHAMVELGKDNSRMKDFYDIWFLSRSFDFRGNALKKAVSRVFERRGTEIPLVVVPLQSDYFVESRENRWTAFKVTLEQAVPEFGSLLATLQAFLEPICVSIHEDLPAGERKTQTGKDSLGKWVAGTGWK